MKIKSLVISISFVLFSPFLQKIAAQDVVIEWSPKMDEFVLGYYKMMANQIGLKNTEVNTISNCMLTQLKAKFPKGLRTSKEKFAEINSGLAKVCLSGKVLIVPWNDSNKAYVRKRFIEELPSDMPEEKKQQIATCFLTKYIAKYPNGVSTDQSVIAAQKADFKAIELICAKEIK